MPVTREPFGTMPDSSSVDQITLSHNNGIILKAIQYGGIIRELHVPDQAGNSTDIVLGLPTLEAYLSGHPWFGAITGRVAGRITAGKFSLDGADYELEQNNEGNLLHGGSNALDKQVWSAQTGETSSGEPWVVFRCVSPDGACGFPGELDISVRYQITDAAELKIEYLASTTRRTPLSLTNHSYFNLAGDGSGTAEDHLVQIHAEHFIPTDETGTLTNQVTPVAGTPNDLRDLKRIGDVLPGIRGNHGENYLVRYGVPKSAVPVLVARIEEPRSGRVMEVLSTESSLQFYSGIALDEKEWISKNGKPYQPYSGLCFEAQGYPEGVNAPEIEDIILNPDDTYTQTTIYRFSSQR